MDRMQEGRPLIRQQINLRRISPREYSSSFGRFFAYELGGEFLYTKYGRGGLDGRSLDQANNATNFSPSGYLLPVQQSSSMMMAESNSFSNPDRLSPPRKSSPFEPKFRLVLPALSALEGVFGSSDWDSDPRNDPYAVVNFTLTTPSNYGS